MKKVWKVIKTILRGFGGVICVALSLALIASIFVANSLAEEYAQAVTTYLGFDEANVVDSDGTIYYESDYSSSEELSEAAGALGTEAEEEGAVLLRNEESALPLAEGSKVSVFGQVSVDFVYGGSGSGSIDSSEASTLKESLEAAGLEVNETLWDFYDTGDGSSYRNEVVSDLGTGSFTVNEVPLSVYSDDVLSSCEEYSDAAIVVIGRSGSESVDLPEGYLSLTEEELDIIDYACENFETVVVLLNSSNAMELGELEDADVDAILWVGAVGQTGIDAIGDILVGDVNPSGHLTDTYAYDVDGAPAMANFGDYTITNSDVDYGTSYISYSEGIYVGYLYYETRYEDVVMGTGNAGSYDYDSEVQYAFGYGLSYTDFEWSDFSITYDEAAGQYVALVTVTNTGSVAGKDVVEVYLQKPYTDYDVENTVEKASVELVGYTKTIELDPGESETVVVTVDEDELRTYDSEGAGTYILESGTYYLAAGTDAHDALNNILAVKGYTMADGMTDSGDASFVYGWDIDVGSDDGVDATTFSVSSVTGYSITNQFDDADLRTYDSDFVYLSRSDWEGTWPTTYADGSWEAPEEFVEALEISYEEDDSATMPETDTVSDEYGELTLAMLIGADYDDERWDALVSQMSVDELWNLVSQSGYLSYGIESIACPQVTLKDGPAGISATLTGGNVSCMSYPSELVLASTWNVDLVYEVGVMVGEDSINAEIAVWYAPAMDIHRTAYSGRNFEYYSEDSYLSGTMAAAEVSGAMEKGVIVTIKHFALNDQETNRMGGAMLACEQAIREIYLEAFEMAVVDGGATGVMVGMNRIGATWTGGHYGLVTEVLRNEWGFEGFTTTDQASFSSFDYCDIREGLAAGTDMWLNVSESMWELSDEELTATVLSQAHEAAHHILYAYANSNAMNGISEGASIELTASTVSWLLPLAWVLLVVLAWCFYKLACLCFGTRTLWQIIRRKPKKRDRKKAAEQAQEAAAGQDEVASEGDGTASV